MWPAPTRGVEQWWQGSPGSCQSLPLLPYPSAVLQLETSLPPRVTVNTRGSRGTGAPRWRHTVRDSWVFAEGSHNIWWPLVPAAEPVLSWLNHSPRGCCYPAMTANCRCKRTWPSRTHTCMDSCTHQTKYVSPNGVTFLQAWRFLSDRCNFHEWTFCEQPYSSLLKCPFSPHTRPLQNSVKTQWLSLTLSSVLFE